MVSPMIDHFDTNINLQFKAGGFNSTMSKTVRNTQSENEIEATNVVTENMIRFVESEDIPGAMKAVIFTPKGWNGHYVTIGLFDTISCMNAMQEFLAEAVVSGGEGLHVRAQSYSLYDGTRSFYLGNSIVLNAIEDGLKSLTVNVGGKNVQVSVPKTADNIGPWTQCNMRLGGFANAIPCKDLGHQINLAKKHEALELMFRGTKLVMYVEPSLVKGEIENKPNKTALELKSRILNEDGTLKSAAEIAKSYFEAKREYTSTNKLQAQAERVAKIAPILNLAVANVIIVDGTGVNPNDVPAGRYLAQKEGKDEVFTHVKNLDSVNTLTMLASRGYTLITQRRF